MAKVYRAVVKVPGTNAYVSCDPDAPLTDYDTAQVIAKHYLTNVIPHSVIYVTDVTNDKRYKVTS